MSRDRILKSIRKGLGASENVMARNEAVARRIAAGGRNLVPQRALKPRAELVQQFVGFLEGQSASVVRVTSADALPAALAIYLRESNLPLRVRMGTDPRLARLPWGTATNLEVRHGRAAADDDVSVSHALAGIAETGTLVLASGPENPVTLSFMPENHVVVLAEDSIVGSLEDGIARARAQSGGAMPRTLNLISGASRTADIGGRIVIGAHGPRRLAVMIVSAS